MKIYIVRHGQTNSNKYDKLIGITDESMNEFGEKQINDLKEKLDKINFDICFTSPFKRTYETANILVENRVSIMSDDRIKERGFGILELEGGSKNTKYTPDFWDYYMNKSDYEVEPLKQLFDRTNDFIQYLKSNYSDKCILIVSHAATIRALHYNLTGFDEKTDMLSFKVDNGQVLEYSF